jgi:tetratricopeptide (TPR) repeat protein
MINKRKTPIYFGLFLIASLAFQASAQTKPDERLYQEAKILLFDEKWEQAQEVLEALLEEYPNSPWYSQSLFYLGKSLEEQGGKEKEALEMYRKYILHKDRNESLTEEAEGSIIDMAYQLYKKGKESYLKEIETRLYRPNKVVRYYAAYKLSLLENKKAARKAIPVLEEILEEEKDNELRDRAKIALLRIDPDAFREFEEKRYQRRVRMLRVRVTNKWTKKATFSFNIPWALADLALANIPDDTKRDLRKEGYDLDKIIQELTRAGEIIEIKTKDSIIKIWIE